MCPSETKLMLTKRFFLFLLHSLQLEREFPAQLRFGEPIPHTQHMDGQEGALAQGPDQCWQLTASPQGTWQQLSSLLASPAGSILMLICK